MKTIRFVNLIFFSTLLMYYGPAVAIAGYLGLAAAEKIVAFVLAW